MADDPERDPLAVRLDSAPADDEPLTDEDREAMREAREDHHARSARELAGGPRRARFTPMHSAEAGTASMASSRRRSRQRD
jgi:hypothetical protein